MCWRDALANPEGRKLLTEIWQDGARMVVENGAQALFYELFNEPAYNDPSPNNRTLFVAALRQT